VFRLVCSRSRIAWTQSVCVANGPLPRWRSDRDFRKGRCRSPDPPPRARHRRTRRAECLGTYLVALAFRRRNELDGYVPGSAIEQLGPKTRRRTVPELLRVGLLEADGDGYRIAKYADKNETKSEICARRAKSAKRQHERRSHASVTRDIGVTARDLSRDQSQSQSQRLESEPDPEGERAHARARPPFGATRTVSSCATSGAKPSSDSRTHSVSMPRPGEHASFRGRSENRESPFSVRPVRAGRGPADPSPLPRERARAAMGVSHRRLQKLLETSEVRVMRAGRFLYVPLTELEEKVPPLWERIKAAESLRRALDDA
jgi:hypothetical protein